MTVWIVMGVAGCGKSSAGHALAARLGLPWIEGDDFHPAANRAKMEQGVALQDQDRVAWLQSLVHEIQRHPAGCVLGCSALKQAYRDTLRLAASDVRFLYLRLTPQESLRRVSSRPGHFFSPALVESQFATLESPESETGVVTVDATEPIDQIVAAALRSFTYS
jgi:gluconokinase